MKLPPAQRFRDVKKVMVIRLDAIGDVILTMPLVREIRANLPHAWICMVVPPAAADLVRACPYVNEVLALQPRGRGILAVSVFFGRALALCLRYIWWRRFEIVIVPRWDIDTFGATWLSMLTGAAQRVGYSTQVRPEKARYNPWFDRLLTLAIDDRQVKHDVLRPLHLLTQLGGDVGSHKLELWTSLEDEHFADEELKRHGVPPGSLLVAIAPGAGHARRMWPVERFVELGQWLENRYGARVVAIGGSTEGPLAAQLAQGIGNSMINLAGRASLLQTVAVMRRCRLVVSNDSAPVHMASASGVPVVEISCHPADGSPLHPSSPARFSPWGVENVVVQPLRAKASCERECAKESAHCITLVSQDDVRAAVVKLLDRARDSEAPPVAYGMR